MELSQFSLSYLRAKSWNWCVAELTGNCTCFFKFFLNLKNQVWIKSWIYIFENLKQKLFIFALKLNTFISRKWIFLNEKCWHQQTWRRLWFLKLYLLISFQKQSPGGVIKILQNSQEPLSVWMLFVLIFATLMIHVYSCDIINSVILLVILFQQVFTCSKLIKWKTQGQEYIQ